MTNYWNIFFRMQITWIEYFHALSPLNITFDRQWFNSTEQQCSIIKKVARYVKRGFLLSSWLQLQHMQMSKNIYITKSNENESILLILSICRFRRQRQAIGRARLSVVVIHLVNEWEKHILRSIMNTVILIDRTQVFFFAFVFRLSKKKNYSVRVL
jgi:hypothetical protein